MSGSTFDRVLKAVRDHVDFHDGSAPKISVTFVMELAGTKSRGGTHQVLKSLLAGEIIVENEGDLGYYWTRGSKFHEDVLRPARRTRKSTSVELMEKVNTLQSSVDQLNEKLDSLARVGR